jgi:hypothetical protein
MLLFCGLLLARWADFDTALQSSHGFAAFTMALMFGYLLWMSFVAPVVVLAALGLHLSWRMTSFA